MAPTTLPNQVTKTSPRGREVEDAGTPLKISEMIGLCERAGYVTRTSLHSPKHVLDAKRAIRKSFQRQIDNEGFSLVEMLSPCPTYWGLKPLQALRWIEEKLIPAFPLGDIRTPS